MKRKAFTLIELLVVIAIIALLLSILMPALTKVKAQAKRIVCASNLQQIGKGIYTYAQSWNDKLPSPQPGSSKYPWRAYLAYADYVNASGVTEYVPWGLGCLYDTDIIEDGKVFYCKNVTGATNPNLCYDKYTEKGPWPTPNDPAVPRVRTSYTYYPQHSDEREKVITILGPISVPMVTDRIVYLSSSKMVVSDLVFRYEEIPHGSDKSPGLNALFGDAHVSYNARGDAFDLDLWYPLGRESDMGPHHDPSSFRAILSLFKP